MRQARGLFRGPPAYAIRTPWHPLPALAVGAALVLLDYACVWLLAQGLGKLWAAALSLVLQIALILGAGTLSGGHAREVLALGRPAGGWRAYARAFLLVPSLIGYALILAMLIGLSLAGHYVALPPAFPPALDATEWALWLAVAVVLGPTREELLFRGFVLPALARTRLGFWGAAFMAAGTWAALHGSLIHFLPLLAIGMLLSWLLWRTGSLRVPIFSHAANNLIVVLAPLAGLPAPLA